jgi:hypothetical protein
VQHLCAPAPLMRETAFSLRFSAQEAPQPGALLVIERRCRINQAPDVIGEIGISATAAMRAVRTV